jgi:hypothetical protein
MAAEPQSPGTHGGAVASTGPDGPAETLSFVQRVMDRTRRQVDEGGWWLIWWGGLTGVAILATLALTYVADLSGPATGWATMAIWIAHNLIGWTGTLLAVRASGVVSVVDRQTLACWAAITLAIWGLLILGPWVGAVAPWATILVVQTLLGLGLVFTGILMQRWWPAGLGLAAIATVPVLMLLPGASMLASAAILTGLMLGGGIVAEIVWRRKTRAAQSD